MTDSEKKEIMTMTKVLEPVWGKCPQDHCPKVDESINACDYCRCMVLYQAGYRKVLKPLKIANKIVGYGIGPDSEYIPKVMLNIGREYIKTQAIKEFAETVVADLQVLLDLPCFNPDRTVREGMNAGLKDAIDIINDHLNKED